MRRPNRAAPRLLLLLMLPMPAHARKAHSEPARVPTAQTQAFGLGFALQSAAARTRVFLDAVKGLRDVADDDEGAAQVARLAEQSRALRRSEAVCYAETARQLQAMGAPPDLQAWARDVAGQLDAPLKLSKEAKNEEKTDSNTATVMGTIDEAQALKVTADGTMPRLRVWVKLAGGARAVWAGALGDLAAEMDAAVVAGRPFPVADVDSLKLAQAAPAGTPPSVTQALKKLRPRRGNLAAAVHAAPAPLAPNDLKEPLQTLLDAFDAAKMADMLDKR